MQKVLPIESKKYLKWVASRACRVTLKQDETVVAHHISAVIPRAKNKVHDIFTLPLSHKEHMDLHNNGAMQWQIDKRTNQAEEVIRTLNDAINMGIIEIKFNL